MTTTLPHTEDFEDAFDAHAPVVELPEVTPPKAPSHFQRARFAGLVAVGYAYIFGLVGAFVLALAAFILAQAIWPIFFVLGALGAILPGLRVKVPPPEGVDVTHETAPDLYELVEQIRRDLRAPRLARITLVATSGAFVCEVPRLGILGWNRIYLALGLPILLTHTPEEVEAVVAHELAHVARRDAGGLAGLRSSFDRWCRLYTRLDETEHWSGVFFRPFLRRYLPHLERELLAFKRWSEYEADRVSAEVAGAGPAAIGLVRETLLGAHLDETVWDRVAERADDEVDPPSPFDLIRRVGARTPIRNVHARIVDLVRHVDSDATHPTVSARLRAVGVAAVDTSLLAPPARTAADTFLGAGLDGIVETFDARWRSDVAEWWSSRHEDAERARRRLATLVELPELSDDERWERADLVARLHGHGAAQPLYEPLLADHPDSPVAHFHVGCALLAADDERGLEHLARAADLAVHATEEAAVVAVPYLVERGRLEEADEWRRRTGEFVELAARASYERSRIRPGDKVVAHDLRDELVSEVRDLVAQVDKVKRAYLVQKDKTLRDEDPIWILGITRRRRWFRLERQRHVDGLIDELLQRLGPIFGGRIWVVLMEGDFAQLEASMTKVDGSQLLGRRSRAARFRARAGVRAYVIAGLVLVALFGAAIKLGPSSDGAPSGTYASAEDAEKVLEDGTTNWAAAANAACAKARASGGDERQLVAALAETGGSAPGSANAIALAQRGLATPDPAVALAARRALTAVGAPACAAP